MRKTKRREKRRWKKLQCAPSLEERAKGSCLSKRIFEKLKTKTKMNVDDVSGLAGDTKCTDEECLLKEIGETDEELREARLSSFSPRAPAKWKKNPYEWLDSNDIENVLLQYEKVYPCFDFIGPSPIDYDSIDKSLGPTTCVWDELCNFNLEEQLERKKHKIGIIFNVDVHTGDGIHWVSMFLNLKKGKIFYFDSAGDEIPPQLQKFVDMVTEQGRQIGKRFTFDQNSPTEHQYGTSECGVYALFFIIQMLRDKISAHALKTRRIKDKHIHKFRKVFFN